MESVARTHSVGSFGLCVFRGMAVDDLLWLALAIKIAAAVVGIHMPYRACARVFAHQDRLKNPLINVIVSFDAKSNLDTIHA